MMQHVLNLFEKNLTLQLLHNLLLVVNHTNFTESAMAIITY